MRGRLVFQEICRAKLLRAARGEWERAGQQTSVGQQGVNGREQGIKDSAGYGEGKV